MVRKKTAEQIAEEQAIALQQRVEKWCNLSAQASDDLDADEKALEELKKRIAQKKRTIGTARKFVREKVAIEFYENVIKIFELTKKEAECNTEEEFRKLLLDILDRFRVASVFTLFDDYDKEYKNDLKEDIIKMFRSDDKCLSSKEQNITFEEIVKQLIVLVKEKKSVEDSELKRIEEEISKVKEEEPNSAEEKLVEAEKEPKEDNSDKVKDKNKVDQDPEPKLLEETSGEVKNPEPEPVVEQPTKVEEEKPSSPEETSDKVDKELETVTESKPKVKEPETVTTEPMPVTEESLSQPEQKTEPKPVTVEESLPKSKKTTSYKYKNNAKMGSYQPQKK